MRLRNIKGKYTHNSINSDDEDEEPKNLLHGDVLEKEPEEENRKKDGEMYGETWVPSMKGFVKCLVDSNLIFDTVGRIVDKSDDVSYAYFRRTGLVRSEDLAKDLEWFSQQDIVIPQRSSPGVSYAKYLEELAEKSAPLFLCHFYNIYFSVFTYSRWSSDSKAALALRCQKQMLKRSNQIIQLFGAHSRLDHLMKRSYLQFKNFLGSIVSVLANLMPLS